MGDIIFDLIRRKKEAAFFIVEIDQADTLIRPVHRHVRCVIVIKVAYDEAIGPAFAFDRVIAKAKAAQTIAKVHIGRITPVIATDQVEMTIPVHIGRSQSLRQCVGWHATT
jgi:hypothetical protein